MQLDPTNLEKQILLDVIKPDGKNILEIGCGDGRASFYLSENANSYLAIDSSESAIGLAQEKLSKTDQSNLEFKVLSAIKTGLPSDSLDLVFMLLSFHEIYVQDQGLALLEAHRVLKKGGQLIIVDPIEPPAGVQSLYNAICKDFDYFDHSVIVKHSRYTLGQIIKDGKFRREKFIPYTIQWKFENLAELCSFMEDEFPEITWDESTRAKVRGTLSMAINNQDPNHELVFDYELGIEILTKK